MQVQSLGQGDCLEKEKATHSKNLPGKSHGQSSLAGYNPWGLKEMDMTEQTFIQGNKSHSILNMNKHKHLIQKCMIRMI